MTRAPTRLPSSPPPTAADRRRRRSPRSASRPRWKPARPNTPDRCPTTPSNGGPAPAEYVHTDPTAWVRTVLGQPAPQPIRLPTPRPERPRAATARTARTTNAGTIALFDLEPATNRPVEQPDTLADSVAAHNSTPQLISGSDVTDAVVGAFSAPLSPQRRRSGRRGRGGTSPPKQSARSATTVGSSPRPRTSCKSGIGSSPRRSANPFPWTRPNSRRSPTSGATPPPAGPRSPAPKLSPPVPSWTPKPASSTPPTTGPPPPHHPRPAQSAGRRDRNRPPRSRPSVTPDEPSTCSSAPQAPGKPPPSPRSPSAGAPNTASAPSSRWPSQRQQPMSWPPPPAPGRRPRRCGSLTTTGKTPIWPASPNSNACAPTSCESARSPPPWIPKPTTCGSATNAAGYGREA